MLRIIRDNLSRTTASLLLALMVWLAAPVTAQAMAKSPMYDAYPPGGAAKTAAPVTKPLPAAQVSTVGSSNVTSGGDPGKTSEAKKGVAFALVGLALAISAEAIAAFVIHRGAP